jgi:hypothetical protein
MKETEKIGRKAAWGISIRHCAVAWASAAQGSRWSPDPEWTLPGAASLQGQGEHIQLLRLTGPARAHCVSPQWLTGQITRVGQSPSSLAHRPGSVQGSQAKARDQHARHQPECLNMRGQNR